MKVGLVHEFGTLWMGTGPKTFLTDVNCRLHSVSDISIGGAAALSTSGLGNPTLAVVALGQRPADHLCPPLAHNGGIHGQ